MVRGKLKTISKIMLLAFTINLLPISSINTFAETTKKENVVIESAQNNNNSIYGPYDSSEQNERAYEPFSEKNTNEGVLDGYEYSDNTLLIKTKNKFRLFKSSGVSNDAIESMEVIDISFGNAKTFSAETEGTWFKAKLKSGSNIEQVMNEVKEDSDVLAVEPEYIRKLEVNIPTAESDESVSEQWYLNTIGVTDAWNHLQEQGINPGGNRDVIVAVIDTGVDYTHPDLVSNIWTNPMEIPNNGIDDDNNGYVDDVHGATTIAGQIHEQPMDYNGHGTHVAGIIAAEANNGLGGAGIAYNVQIMPIKAAQDGGILTSSDIARAIIYAAENGADVINMSFGGYGRSVIEEDALAMAFSTSVLVAAGGNDGSANESTLLTPTGKPMYPAAYPWVLGVMASSPTANGKGDWLASFSNWDINTENSFEYELMAPGSKIFSTLPNNQYAKWDGTSMAAPVVSAIAALVRSKFDDKDNYSSRFIMGQLASTGVEKQGKTYSNDKAPKMYNEVSALNALTQTPKPNVTYIEHYLFDKSDVESTTAGDGIVDAGETVDIGMVIRNHWGKAEDVNVTIDAVLPSGASDPYVEIINNTVNYGAIGNFGTDDNGFIYENDVVVGVRSPFTVKVKENAPNDHYVKLNVTITARNGFDSNDSTTYTTEDAISFVIRKGNVVPAIIKNDIVLSKDKYWIISDRVLIKSGVNVTVEPGTTIQFWSDDKNNPYANQSMASIRVEGNLYMNGTEDEPINLISGPLHKSFEVKILATNDLSYPDNPGILYSPSLGNEIGGYAELSYVNIENPVLSVSKINNCFFSQNYDYMTRRYRYNGKVYQENNYGPIVKTNEVNKSKFYKLGVENYEWDAFMLWADTVNENIFDNSYAYYKFSNGYSNQVIKSANNNVFLSNYKYKKDYSSRAEVENIGDNNLCNNAILNNWLDINVDHWLKFIAKGDRNDRNDISNNYWGTTSKTLIENSIIDFYDDYSMPELVYNPILIEAPETAYPFVTNIYLTNSDGTTVTKVGAEKVNVHVKFNRDMNTSVEPTVTFGPDMPTTDYRVTTIEEGGWVSSREWVGQINITPMTGDGYQFFRVIGGEASDNSWLVSGDDRERFKFEIITSGVESMNLQAEGNGNKIKLSWFQDDFDTLAGYNIYRSESEDGYYEKINKAIIPSHIKTFEDTKVEPGKTYYYKFTVLQTDMSESDYSNVASAAAVDSILPTIDHNTVTEASAYMPVKITANVTDNVLVKGVNLYFRKVGETEYKKKEMTNLEGMRYSATIEGSNVTPAGIEYYIEATDGTNVATSGSSTNPHRINIADKPKITSISPAEGADIGGNKVTITGTNFKEGAKVYFNGVQATNVVVESTTRLTAVTPSNNAGTVDVKVENSNGGLDTLYNAFTYTKEGISLTVNNAQGKKGGIIEVPVEVNYIDGLTSGDFTFEYDSSVLKFIEARSGDLTNNFMVIGNEVESGKVNISMAGTEAVNGMGNILNVKLQVLDEPSSNSSVLTLSKVELNGGAISVNVNNGQFNILEGHSVYGNVYYHHNYQSIGGVKVMLNGDNGYHDVLSENGHYTIRDVYDGSYQLSAVKDQGVNGIENNINSSINSNDINNSKASEANSITAYDASLVLQAAVGKTTLGQYQGIAADVNSDGKVNAVDASLILSYSAGKTSLPFQGSSDIWKFETYNRNVIVSGYDSYGNDLYGVLLGDVSGNWNSMSDPEVRDSKADFNIGSVVNNVDGTFTVPVTVSMENANLFGSDMLISYDSSVNTLVSVEKASSISNFGIDYSQASPGEVKVSFAGADAFDSSDKVINLVFTSSNKSNLIATTVVESAEVNERNVTSVVYRSKDMNSDKIIDILDVADLAMGYNSTNENTGFINKRDINKDGIIDIFDLIQVSRVIE